MPKIIAVSDTHGYNLRTKVDWDQYPGNIIVHAGDGTPRGTPDSIKQFGKQFLDTPYRYHVYSPGNHDKLFFTNPVEATKLLPGIIVLIDETVELMGLRFYGMPWLPNNSGTLSHAFETNDLKERTDAIPTDTDVLVCHTPPYGILDGAWRNWIRNGYGKPIKQLDNTLEHMGNRHLANRLSFDHFAPSIIISGHIHEARGFTKLNSTKVFNASLCDRDYKLSNTPWEIEI